MASRLVSRGLLELARGTRRGSPGLAGVGAAMLAVGMLRSRRRGKELLFSTTLKPGQGLKIVRPDTGKSVEIS